MKGFNTGDGYMGLVDGKYILFASESDYYEYYQNDSYIFCGSRDDGIAICLSEYISCIRKCDSFNFSCFIKKGNIAVTAYFYFASRLTRTGESCFLGRTVCGYGCSNSYRNFVF